MTVRTLDTRSLDRALLARQLLLERVARPIPEAIEQVGGLQTQYAPSGYVGLWTRLAGFEREALTRALDDRSVIQATLMRSTIHLVSAADYWPFAIGTRDARWESWQRGYRRGPTPRAALAAARRVERLLFEGPRTRAELVDGIDAARFYGAGTRLNLVRVPPSGTWERPRGDLYATAETWLGPSNASEEEGLELLLRRYLGAFGPAPLKDAANWAGLPPKALAPAAEAMPLRRFRDESGGELLDLPRGPLPDGETPAPPRFLATWDATLLAHARRTQILPERHRPKVFDTKTPPCPARKFSILRPRGRTSRS